MSECSAIRNTHHPGCIPANVLNFYGFRSNFQFARNMGIEEQANCHHKGTTIQIQHWDAVVQLAQPFSIWEKNHHDTQVRDRNYTGHIWDVLWTTGGIPIYVNFLTFNNACIYVAFVLIKIFFLIKKRKPFFKQRIN